VRNYDVVIVGAGPAGLRCAEILSKSKLSVLLLEKNPVFGDKVCAGGITRKGFELLNIPDKVIEHKVDEVIMYSRHYHNHKYLPVPVMYTVDRRLFADWQVQRINGGKVKIEKNARVTKINKNRLTVNGDEEIAFEYLVGADGPNSFVRKYLKIPVEKVLASVQYIIPATNVKSCLKMYLDAKYFHSWYAWSFPHKNSVAVGACCNPKYLSGKQLKTNFHNWLNERGYDISKAKYESYPISYDYRGLQFGNIFLTGEAAGLASGFTGEGIYQSLVSGEEVANLILHKNYRSENFQYILKYNGI